MPVTQNPRNDLAMLVALGAAAAVGLGGFAAGWYAALPWYDGFAHAVVSAGVTFAAGVWLYQRALTGAVASPGLLILTLVVLGLGIGAAWEMLEFAYDHLSGEASTIRPKPDTMADLGWDAVGALIGGWGVVALVTRARA